MRYMIMKPREGTFDPRPMKIESLAMLDDMLPPVAECGSEREAIELVRKMMPDAVGMPCPVPIGSGSTILLCFVEDANVYPDPDSTLEFVLFVRPVPGDDTERKAVKRATEGNVSLVFDGLAWAPKPKRPDIGRDVPVEVRTNELALPTFTDARVGYADGKLVVFLEIGNIECSIEFRQPGFEIVDRRKEENDRLADRADAVSL